MTIKKIIDGLYFTIGMMLFNPLTGESKTPEELNEDDRTTYDACMGAIELLKELEHADFIPIDWLMNYAQLPTEFAISKWRKPKREVKIRQAKSLDKPMMLDDALELLKAQEPVKPTVRYMEEYDGHGSDWYVCGACEMPIFPADKYCRHCGRAVKWND